MKRRTLMLSASASALAACDAQTRSGGAYDFVRGYPTDTAAQKAQDDADFQRAVSAYRFWYPTVSMEGIFNGNRQVGLADGQAMGIAATGPRQVGFTLNSDTPYGSAVLDLAKGPMVIELPPGPFIGLVDDHNQGWVMDLGLPGPDAGRGGRHLVLPPGYRGTVPAGTYVGRSPTLKAMIAVRAMPVGGDLDRALNALRGVKIYALNGPRTPLDIVDTSKNKMDSTSLLWEDNIQYWEVLARIVDAESAIEAWRPQYGELAALGIQKGKPFAPDARLKAILERAAKAGRDQMLVSAFASTRPDRIAWPDRRWEWVGLIGDNADFRTPGGVDLEARDRWFAQAIVTSPAMFRRTAGAGSLYWLAARDRSGAYLDGGKSYRLTVPTPVPGKLFWSVTVYDSQTRSQVQTDQDKAALRSLFELKDVASAAGSGQVTLFFGPTAPPGSEGRWIKTAPGRGWFAYFRIYGPEGPAFDGTWKPGDFEEMR
jgi:hypothetical protein